MPEEVNIDDLLDLKTDEERTQQLQVTALAPPPQCMGHKPRLFVSDGSNVDVLISMPRVSLTCVFFCFQIILRSCNNNTEVSLYDINDHPFIHFAISLVMVRL